MLNIINNLKPFFEDCYREIAVREYARETKMSAPTASKLLKNFEKEGLLKAREERRHLLFKTNRESTIMKDLSRIYWKEKFAKLIEHLNKKFYSPTMILFGSLAKLEVTKNSDIDIVLLTKIKKEINLKDFEKKLGRKIQLLNYEEIDKINKDFRLNILNGYILKGSIK